MSNYVTARNLAMAFAAVGAIVYIPGKLSGRSSNPLETAGTENVERAFTRGGGTPTHKPAVATRRDDPDSTATPQSADTYTGAGTETFRKSHAEAKAMAPGTWEKTWNKAHYGQDKGK